MDVFTSGSWRTPRRGEVLVGGTWRTITRGEQYRSGAWARIVAFTSPLSVTANDATGSIVNRKPAPVTSNYSIATPSGGLGPYSYVWTITEGSAVALTPNMAATQFRGTVAPGNDTYSMARVVCTDALGTTATTLVGISLFNEGQF